MSDELYVLKLVAERLDDARIAFMVTAEDLLLSTLHWAKDSRSEMQLRDVRNLIAAVAGLDWPYIERWVGELDVRQLLDEVRA